MADVFDSLRYIAGYPDLIRVFGLNADAGRAHYEAYGRAEGRDPLKFNPMAYAATYGDLIKAFGDNPRALSQHYIEHGFAEGRTARFDALAYGASFADLIRTFGDDVQALTQHYVRHGFGEGRKASFDPLAYGASHSDLIRAFGDDPAALARHYIQHGFAEGRSISFDPLAYGASHSDLIIAFGDDAAALARHFIRHGSAEGRGSTFTAAAYAAANPDLDPALAGDAHALTLHFLHTGFAAGRLVATILGTPQDDVIGGTASRDIIAGGAGDDLFVASTGGDRYIGGAGVDTLDYSRIAAPITVTRTGVETTFAFDLTRDTAILVERLMLGTGNDRVTLDGMRDIVFGGAGADVIIGRGGGDELHGGEGDDLLSSVVVDGPLPEGIDVLFGDAGYDTLILGGRGGVAYGGDESDSFILSQLVGSATAELHGGSGRDQVSLGVVGDLVVRPDGSITLLDRTTGDVRAILTSIEYIASLPMTPLGIADGVVRITGQGGAVVVYAGRGTHEIRGTFAVTDPVNSVGFQLSYGRQSIDATFLGGGRLSFSTSEGSAQAIIRGDANVEFNINGDANIQLGQGSDRFVVSGGISTLDGGAGDDTLWLLGAAPMTIDLKQGVAATQGTSIRFVQIEHAIGGDADDVIIGDDAANVLRGMGGNDRIYGGATGSDGRFDVLLGQAGDDLLVGGGGYDSLRGDAGNDLLVDRADGSFSGGEGDDRIVILLDDAATSQGHTAWSDGGAGADTFIISAIVGTFGEIRLGDFRPADGDRIDFSNLRDLGGGLIDLGDVVAAASATPGWLQIQLDHFRSAGGAALSGQLWIADLADPAALSATMFVFESGFDWRPLVPSDWLL